MLRRLCVTGLALYFTLLYVNKGHVQDPNFAGTAYANGDFAAAISGYMALLEQGGDEGAIYYNLGLSYAQAGDVGRAILSMRRAQAFIPRDEDLIVSLQVLRSERQDLQGDETHLLDSMAAFTSATLTTSELAVFTYVTWALWSGLAGVALFSKQRRVVMLRTLVVASIPLMFLLASLICREMIGSTRHSAVVVRESSPIMSGPGDQYLCQYVLHTGTELRILTQSKDSRWIRFILPDSRQGWIASDAVELVGFS